MKQKAPASLEVRAPYGLTIPARKAALAAAV